MIEVKKVIISLLCMISYSIKIFKGIIYDLCMIRRNFINRKSQNILVLYYDFQKNNKWQVAGQYYFYRDYINEFKPIIVSSIVGKILFFRKNKIYFSAEPKYAAPPLGFPVDSMNMVFISDPWSKPDWLPNYYLSKNINFIFTPYRKMFLNTPGLEMINSTKVISFPWSVPDEFISRGLSVHNNSINIFGALKNSDFYNLRVALSNHPLVSKSFNFGGSENKAYSLNEYYSWLGGFSCCIAVVSDDDYYSFPVAKYFEIPAAGVLLFCYKNNELEELGFKHKENCIIFDSFESFEVEARNYIDNYLDYSEIRLNGIKHISDKHSVSQRIKFIKDHFAL